MMTTAGLYAILPIASRIMQPDSMKPDAENAMSTYHGWSRLPIFGSNTTTGSDIAAKNSTTENRAVRRRKSRHPVFSSSLCASRQNTAQHREQRHVKGEQYPAKQRGLPKLGCRCRQYDDQHCYGRFEKCSSFPFFVFHQMSHSAARFLWIIVLHAAGGPYGIHKFHDWRQCVLSPDNTE